MGCKEEEGNRRYGQRWMERMEVVERRKKDLGRGTWILYRRITGRKEQSGRKRETEEEV